MHVSQGGQQRGRLSLVAAAVLIFAACSPGNTERADTESLANATADEAEQDATTGEVEEVDAVDTETAEVEQAETADTEETMEDPPDQPLATVEGSTPFVELEITDLRRAHDTVTVEFVIITDDSPSGPTQDVFAAPQDQTSALLEEMSIVAASRQPVIHSVSGVTLVDPVNRKRHLVLRDSGGECLCTRFDVTAEPEARHPHSAQFPAPPDDVQEMTVQVPRFPAVDSVPLRTVSQ